MQIHVNGVLINYELEGSDDAPCVTFSHSLACDLTMWDDQAAFLRERYRVLRYDVAGTAVRRAPREPTISIC